MLLDVRNLHAGYGEVAVLRDVSFAVTDGAITALIGSNGSGKTTMMRAVAGLLPARSGRIDFAGRDLTHARPSERVEAGLALVPEGRLVFPEFTVEDTLRVGAYCTRARAGMAERKAQMYALFPRLYERRRSPAGALSGGEQQMLAIARGLMSAPSLLLLDEPSLGLAPVVVAQLFAAIVAIAKSGVAVCLVEQDVNLSLEIADYAYVLENGAIVLKGPARELIQSDQVRTSYLGF
ncbi:MAG: ABC transporter ATP-binding protein [Methylocella sp.]|jgi:branched-chain amino acid transport system ATP-binding protein